MKLNEHLYRVATINPDSFEMDFFNDYRKELSLKCLIWKLRHVTLIWMQFECRARLYRVATTCIVDVGQNLPRGPVRGQLQAVLNVMGNFFNLKWQLLQVPITRKKNFENRTRNGWVMTFQIFLFGKNGKRLSQNVLHKPRSIFLHNIFN